MNTKTVRILNRWFMEPDPGYYGVRVDTIKAYRDVWQEAQEALKEPKP